MSTVLSHTHERALLLTLMAVQFTVIIDFMLLMPLSSQLMDAFVIQPAQFGLLVSCYSFAAGLSTLIASAFADRYDRRTLLIGCYLGLLVGTFGCGLAQSYTQLLTARVVAGFFGGVLSAVTLAIVGDLIPLSRRGKAMGVVMLAFSLASLLGVPLGLVIANYFSWQAPFLFLSLVCLATILVTWFTVPPVRAHLQETSSVTLWQSYKQLLVIPNHWWAFLTSGLMMFSGFMVIPYIAPTMVSNSGLTNHDLTYVYLIGGVATLVTRPIIAHFTDHYSHASVFAWIVIIGFLPIMLITQTLPVSLGWQLLFAGLFFVFVSGRFIPCTALITASCEPRYRGRVMAFNSAIQNLGLSVAAYFAGVIMVKNESGEILHFDWVGYLSCMVGAVSIWTASKIKTVA